MTGVTDRPLAGMRIGEDAPLVLDVQACREALLRAPDPETMIRMGDAFFAAGRGLDALRLILEVTSRRLEDWRLSLAGADVILRQTAAYDIVETLLRNVLRLQPDNLLVQAFRARVLMAGGDVAGGGALFDDMLRRYPAPDQQVMICELMSGAFLDVGHPMESLRVLLSHLETGRATPAILSNVGCSLEYLNRSDEALPWFEKALALDAADAGIRVGYACTLIKAGRLGEGWPLYADRVLSVEDPEPWYLSLPCLRPGDDVAGRGIVLFQEQGLGDTLQFIRFVPDLLAKGARITVLVPRPLVRLLTHSYPTVAVRELGRFGPEDGYAYALPIPDLPYIAGMMSMRDIPAPIPYLWVDPDDVARFAALLPARRPRIGLVWAGDRRTRSAHVLIDRRRSTTLAALGAALMPVEATLVSLQFGGPRGEIAAWTGQALCDPMGAVRDMADTAAIVKNLDLVISVDTSPLHLAGAVGCPVWLISRQDACWRWGDAGDRSPWYPAMRIFRAQEASFGPVLREVGIALRAWVECWRPSDLKQGGLGWEKNGNDR